MAKRQKNHQVRVAFHLLVKSMPGDEPESEPIESGFSEIEFQRVIDRISKIEELDIKDEKVIEKIKSGKDLPFMDFDQPELGVYFGIYEGAYYGQRFRNNVHGDINPDSLNLRKFFYIITRLDDGSILVGCTYHGQFGDYDGLRSCLSHLLGGNHIVRSKALKSVASELGGGVPVEFKMTYHRKSDRPERTAIFGRGGLIAVKSSDFGDGFQDQISNIASRMKGDYNKRKRVLSELINQNLGMLAIDADDLTGCSVVVRDGFIQRTVYLLGENSFSTKFNLNVSANDEGEFDRIAVYNAVITVMRDEIIPLVAR